MKLILPLPPLGVNNGYFTARNGKRVKDNRLKDWEEECLETLKYDQKILLGGIWLGAIWTGQTIFSVRIWFWFDEKDSGKKSRNDIDNRIKFVLDLLTKAGVYPDDSVITDLEVHKRFTAQKPFIEIEL